MAGVFIEGVAEIAKASIDTCTKITELRDRDFAAMEKLGKNQLRQLWR